MIVIDGKEAGGQILRSALGLSAITNKPIRVVNIRGARAESGLKSQHLEGILAVAQLCNAKVKGTYLGSKEIEFVPREIKAKELNIKLPTASSIGLLFQSLQIPSTFAGTPVKIHIVGGSTASAWSPTLEYLQNIFLSVVGKTGYDANIEIIKHGFYPKGNAEVIIVVQPTKKLNSIQLTERGKVKCIKGISIAGSLPKNVVERQTSSAIKTLKEHGFDDIHISSRLVNTFSPGTSITLWAECENTILGADNIGKKGVRAETIGEQCARELIASIESQTALDKYMADQILTYLSLADSESKVTVEQITDHCLTNIQIIEKMLAVKFDIKRKKEEFGEISVKGIGFEIG